LLAIGVTNIYFTLDIDLWMLERSLRDFRYFCVGIERGMSVFGDISLTSSVYLSYTLSLSAGFISDFGHFLAYFMVEKDLCSRFGV
jgi:hypothetical protein